MSARALLVTCLLALAAGCATALVRPTADDAARAVRMWPDANLAQLERGRELFVARCGSCHRLYLPSDESASSWPRVLDVMAPRATLAPEEREAVERFLITETGR